ncbi:MAG: hypothetical protein ACJ77N_06745 [Chloroflexota bacterium]
MRSTRAVVATIALLAVVPIALAVAIVTGGGGEVIIHFGIGAACLLMAVAVFDFPLPRAVNWIGSLAIGAFGAIFVLQGVSDAVGLEPLHTLAFQVLGQQIEGFLPDVFFVWCVALVLLASEGRTRIFGAVAMTVTLVIEAAVYIGPVVGLAVPNPKLHLLLPILWLLLESLKSRTGDSAAAVVRPPKLAETPAS